MSSQIDSLIAAIEEGRLLNADAASTIDADALLDDRDSDQSFEAEWLRVQRQIEELWEATATVAADAEAVDSLRKAAFLAVSRATEQHELAGYVSDDFELIAKAVSLGCNDAWLNGLFMTYKTGGIGRPDFEPHPGELGALV